MYRVDGDGSSHGSYWYYASDILIEANICQSFGEIEANVFIVLGGLLSRELLMCSYFQHHP